MRIVFVVLILFASGVSKAQPKERWIFETKGKVYSSPTIDGDRLFIGSGDQYFYALNKNTGKALWTFKTGGPVHSSPVVSGGLVFFSSHDGFIYALKKDTGALVWKYQTGGEKFYDLWDYYISSPVIRDGVLYIGSGDNHVYALDELTGKPVWKFKTDGVVHAAPVISDSSLYIGSFDGNLYALQLTDGKLRWKFKTLGEEYFPKGEVQKDALVHEGVVYFGSRDYNLYAVDTRTGGLKWKIKEEGSWVIATPFAYNGDLFFGTSDSEAFYCRNADSGDLKWKRGLNMRVFGMATALNDVIVFGCFNGKLYGVDPATGLSRWEFQTRGSKANSKEVYDETGAFRKDFQKYGDDIEGSERKLLALGSILSTPLIDEKSIYFGSADGFVYALSHE